MFKTKNSDLKSLIQRLACIWNAHRAKKKDGPFNIFSQDPNCDVFLSAVITQDSSDQLCLWELDFPSEEDR